MGNALRSVGSTASGIVSGAAKEAVDVGKGALAGMSPREVGRLNSCRQLANFPGGMMSATYQRNCRNAVVTCQRIQAVNPSSTPDPYCSQLLGANQIPGMWGQTASPFAMMPGLNTPGMGNPGNNVMTSQVSDPGKIGYSIPPPDSMAMGVGFYGTPPGSMASQDFGRMATDTIANYFFPGGGGRSRNNRFNDYDDYGDDYGGGGRDGYDDEDY